MATKKTTKKTKEEKVEKVEKEQIEVVEVKEAKNESKRKNIFVYFLMMLGIFAMIDFAMMFISTDLSNIATYYKYGDDIILEIFYAILVLIVMLLFKNAYVFTNKQEKLYKALLMGAPMIMFSTIILCTNITDLSMKNPSVLTGRNIISVLLLCGLIGITEEFLCRGWLQNEFLERYGDTKKNVITSVLLASFIFGIMHLVNVITTTQNFFETLLQILNAMSVGFLFGMLYYKTKNIWSVIILHAYYDFAIMIGELAVVKDCTYGVVTNKILLTSSFSTIMLCSFWVICGLLILKRCNFPDEKAEYSRTKLRDFYLITIPLMVFTFVFSVFPFENIIEDYTDYYICYNYNEIKLDSNYVIHYPVYDKYTINYEDAKASYMIENETISEIVTVGNYKFELYIQDRMPVIKNVNTETEVKLSNDIAYDMAVVENNDSYVITIVTMDKEYNEHVYVSDIMSKDSLSNTDEYLKMVRDSFRPLELPDIESVGYITIEGKDGNYPAYVSSDHDLFIILDDELYLVKK